MLVDAPRRQRGLAPVGGDRRVRSRGASLVLLLVEMRRSTRGERGRRGERAARGGGACSPRCCGRRACRRARAWWGRASSCSPTRRARWRSPATTGEPRRAARDEAIARLAKSGAERAPRRARLRRGRGRAAARRVAGRAKLSSREPRSDLGGRAARARRVARGAAGGRRRRQRRAARRSAGGRLGGDPARARRRRCTSRSTPSPRRATCPPTRASGA